MPTQSKKKTTSKKAKPISRSPVRSKDTLVQNITILKKQVRSLQTQIHSLQGQLTLLSSGIQVDNAGQVTIGRATPVTIQGSTLYITASLVDVQTGSSTFSGVVQADTVITNKVISSSYTPGAGNIW